MFVRSSRTLFSRSTLWASVSTQKSFLQANRYMGAVAEDISPGEVTERILETIRNYEKVDPTKVNKTAHFVKDLGLDSLDAVEVVMALEDEFCIEIPEETACSIASIPDAVSCIVNHPHAK